MNKNTFDTSYALGEMDDALVSEAARAGKKRRRAAWLIPAAAALIMIAGTAIVLPKILNKVNEISAALNTPAPYYGDPTAAPAETDAAATFDPAEATIEPMMTQPPEEPPVERRNYMTVVELKAAVSSGKHSEGDALDGLTEIYMPVRVPYGAELEDIDVMPERVKVTYKISDEYAVEEDDPNRVVLVWYRNWEKGTAESFARSLHDSEYGYFFREAYGTWIFQTGLEIVAVWEENGRGFELVLPGYYAEDGDIMNFKQLTRVKLDEASEHDPYEGGEDDCYLQLKELEFTFAPTASFAYGRSYYDPERIGGGVGTMLDADGVGFIESIPEDMRDLENLMKYFPHTGNLYEFVLRDNTEIASIDVYDVITLEPIALDITADELRDIADGNVSEELQDRIFRACAGCVLVDVTALHTGDYIAELNEYECDAYHCGFIIECGD